MTRGASDFLRQSPHSCSVNRNDLTLFNEYQDEMEALACDRQKLLEVIGLNDHEWACRGGRRFESHMRFEEWCKYNCKIENVVDDDAPEKSTPPIAPEEVDYSVMVASVAAQPLRQPPPLPSPPPLPPPLPSALVVSAPSAMLPPPLPRLVWTDEQERALDAIAAWNPDGFDDNSFFALTGPAGSGKSVLIREIADRYPQAVLCALTGKAALRLSYCAGRAATTLHSILYWPPRPGESLKFTRVREQPSRFVIVDESSLMTPSIYIDLQMWAANGVKILLVGDPYQLPPVITGDELKKFGRDYSIFAHVKGVELQTVMRSVGGVLRVATKVRETGEIVRESDEGYQYVRDVKPMQRAVEDYLQDREEHFLITWKNSVRMAANRAIRARLGHDGPLPDVGEPVLIRRNGQGRLNGEIMECGGWEDGPMLGSLRCLWMKTGVSRLLVSVDGGPRDKGGEFFDGQAAWVENWSRYHIEIKKLELPEPTPVTFAYAQTCHSVQGSECRRATIFLERGDAGNPHFRELTTLPNGQQVTTACRWAYTALTRSKSRATMIVGR